MSSGGALPPTSFNHFGYLFNPQPHFFTPNQQRIKMKRQRQRVDAGEPRNSYQQPRVPQKLESATKTIEQAATATPLNVTQLFPSLPWLQASTEAESESKSDLLQKLRPEGADKESTADTQENETQRGLEDAPVSNASGAESTSSSSSSSSRRKSFFPQKNASEVFDKSSDDLLDMEDESEWGAKEDEGEDDKEETTIELNNQSTGNKLNDIIEAQKKFYSNFIEQHNKMTNGKSSSDLTALAAFLKQAIITSVVGSIDEIVNQWLEKEKKKSESSISDANVSTSTSLFPPQVQQTNTFRPNTATIFPPPFLGFPNGIFNNEENMRKRKLESPSIRNKVAKEEIDDQETSTSQMTSLFNYLPATMVGQSIFDASRLNASIHSPAHSDDNSDYDPDDPDCQLSGSDLKKSKLMFFYTRYPNPTNLKQYFPEFQFRKKSSGQLVKWFSNFREFYYNQMEKYAKEAVAKGIRRREEIIVTRDSEIFKQLNQHYNRNNHFEAPERFIWVVQETLREFHEAIMLGKHEEPSWKKPIYKIICRYDDPIPSFFKDTKFLDREQ